MFNMIRKLDMAETVEMQRYRMVVEYDGGDFAGWQLQPSERSVQGALEEAVAKLYQDDIRVHGSGRTDAGVHARGQVAHFDAPRAYDSRTILNALNAELPHDVSVRKVDPVDSSFHSRFSASSREYEYTITHARVSIDRRRQWILYSGLKHDLIEEAVSLLEGTHDFTGFSKFAPGKDHHYCHVFRARWYREGQTTRFVIKANRFLQGMVRCLVGGLVLVGRKKLSVEDFKIILESRDRSLAPMLVPPHGLVLRRIGFNAGERALVDEIKERMKWKET